jgi:hypothetical protein
MKDMNCKISGFLNRNKIIIIYSILLAIICYGYELFNFSMSIDEEVQSFSKASELKKLIVDGRWGSYLFHILISPSSILPYIPILFSVIFLASTSILFVTSENCDTTSKIVFSSIFITYPLHSYYLAFNVLSAALTFSMVLSMISFLLVKEFVEQKRKKILYLLLAVLLLMFSFSIYQGVIPIYVITVLIYLFMRITKNEEIPLKILFNRLLIFFMVFGLAIFLGKIVELFMKSFLAPEYTNYINYTSRFWGWNQIPTSSVILNLITYTWNYLSGNFFYGAISIKTLFLLIPFTLFLAYKRVKNFKSKILVIVLLPLLVFSPFLVMYVVGSKLPPRSLVGLPLMFAFFWWISFQYFHVRIKYVMIIILGAVVLSNIYHTTRLFYAGNVSWNADRDMANRIIERIYSLDLPVGEESLTVAFVGKYQHPSNALFLSSNVFGASFFSWDNGNPSRMNFFFKTIGISNIKTVPKITTEKIGERVRGVPCWPNKGSVFLINDTVVVKLSNERVRNKIKMEDY